MKNTLKENGFKNVNEGPQKYRGSASYINYIVFNLDISKRNNIYRHHKIWPSNDNNISRFIFFI
jgi:hypothetical protein